MYSKFGILWIEDCDFGEVYVISCNENKLKFGCL